MLLKIRTCWLLVLSFALLSRANNLNDDILTILNSTTGTSTFVSYLQNRTTLRETLDGGNFTVLVPNNQAFTQSDASTLGSKALGALLQYHVVQGIFPSSTFTTAAVFPPTLLSDTTYTNVTGGQVVELKNRNGVATVLSGLKSPSKVVQADIFFAGGLIHVIDTVLTIPMSLSDTITQAQLNYLTALLNDAGWLAPSPDFDAAIALPDLTVFGPNDPRFGASYTGFQNLTAAERLEVFSYHCVAGNVVYSPELTNDTHFTTLNNLSITSYDINDKTYINNAQVTTKDYLTSNGVLQVINYLLDPEDTTATPPGIETPDSSKSSGGGLSGGAKAGIAVGVVAVVLLAAVAIFLYLRWWRKKRQHPSGGVELPDTDREPAAELSGKPVPYAVEAGGAPIYESGERGASLDKKNVPEPPPVEIDGEMVQRPGDGMVQRPDDGTVSSPEQSRTSRTVTEDWSNAGDRGVGESR